MTEELSLARPVRQTLPRVALGMLALLYLGVGSWSWPTLPGQGMDLTVNLLAGVWLALGGIGLCGVLWGRHLRGGTVGMMAAAGAVFMTLPLLWTPADFWNGALQRLVGVWVLTLFLWVLLQFPGRGGFRRGVYGLIVLAGWAQAGLAGWQVLLPVSAGWWLGYDVAAANGRALGSLMQANLLGSFVATALLCAVWMAVSETGRRWRALAWLSVGVLAAGVVMSESRSAEAGATVGVLMLLCCLPLRARSRGAVLLVLVAGLTAGQVGLHGRPATLPSSGPDGASSLTQDIRPTNVDARLVWNRQHSGDERLTLLRGALSITVDHPYAGLGLGTFETRFPSILNEHGIANPFTVTAQHPHNELLYVWAEGGLVALAGLLLWLGIWLLPFRLTREPDGCGAQMRYRPVARIRFASRATAARGVLTLPLMVHVMTEYPLYQSVVHGITLVVLLWLALPASLRRPVVSGRQYSRLLASVVAGVSLAGMGFMVTGLQSATCLREAEQFGLMDATPLSRVMNPYAQPDRLLFDRAVSNLMQFNLTRDPARLLQFQSQAEQWLTRHNDANLTATLIKIAVVQQNPSQREAWRLRGCLSFPQDNRFACLPADTDLSGQPEEALE
ncbi:hypothetical protein FH968_00170 [Buttiauxella sp. B2]|uniref:O-antigen ligase family protein n=1 Tax=Buttiauxella sp. B2 TaxID=2587812 RepID=UPI00111CE96B|nr:O-antigen ligase family protein [Buttiauxella sp. B2]TNV22513.1 hypothetical protein FH968_00170 [Buttiauxella sp. B2]